MKYPIGIQDFEKIIEDGFVYLDKTGLVYDLVHNGTVYFLCRPRRFGKSLLVSTLKYYFEGKRSCSRGLLLINWRRNGSNILCFISTSMAIISLILESLRSY